MMSFWFLPESLRLFPCSLQMLVLFSKSDKYPTNNNPNQTSNNTRLFLENRKSRWKKNKKQKKTASQILNYYYQWLAGGFFVRSPMIFLPPSFRPLANGKIRVVNMTNAHISKEIPIRMEIYQNPSWWFFTNQPLWKIWHIVKNGWTSSRIESYGLHLITWTIWSW